MRPKISVIVPIYNVEKYLDRCIKSVQQQSLKDIEIILVDDQSPDNCPSMCDKYAQEDSRIKVIHKKNGGLGLARNSGLEIATGEYVTFIDSDDFIALNTYEHIYNVAIQKKLDICYFRFCRYHNNNQISQVKDWNKEEYFTGKKEINKFLLEMVGSTPSDKIDIKYSMSVCKAIFKLDIIKNNNITFVSEREIASEDLIFHLHLLPHINSIGYIPKAYYYYFINTDSITSNYSKEKYLRLIKLLKQVEIELKKYFTYEEYKIHLYSQYLRIYKVIIDKEISQKKSFTYKYQRIKEICSTPSLQRFYKEKFIYNFSLKNSMYIFCMKHCIPLFFFFFYKSKSIKLR